MLHIASLPLTGRCWLYFQVAILQGQLNKERELRKALEAGLEMPQGSLRLSASIDEKVCLPHNHLVQLV